MERKFLIIARHGQKPADGSDTIVPEAIPQLYSAASKFPGREIGETGIDASNAFLEYSGAQRTLATGKVLYAGASQITLPRTVHFAMGIPVETSENPLLNFKDLKFDKDEFMRMTEPVWIDLWMRNPENPAQLSEGTTPFREIYERRKEVAGRAVERLKNGSNLGILVSHAGFAEAVTMGLIGKVVPPEEIGGAFKMGDYATLTCDYNPASGNVSNRILTKGDFVKRL
jgi:hypothetical protein